MIFYYFYGIDLDDISDNLDGQGQKSKSSSWSFGLGFLTSVHTKDLSSGGQWRGHEIDPKLSTIIIDL